MFDAEVLVANLTIVSSGSGSLTTPMLDYKSITLGGHSGQALKESVLEMLATHPSVFTLPSLQSRLAMLDGDGQIVAGGPRKRHNSSSAAELLWRHVHPEVETDDSLVVCTRWDDFHRTA